MAQECILGDGWISDVDPYGPALFALSDYPRRQTHMGMVSADVPRGVSGRRSNFGFDIAPVWQKHKLIH